MEKRGQGYDRSPMIMFPVKRDPHLSVKEKVIGVLVCLGNLSPAN